MTGVAAIALCAAFTSCSKGDELYDQGAIDQMDKAKVTQTYNEAFIKVFGQPSANQDWGFGSSAKTRSSEPNGQLWARFDPQYKDQYNYDVPAPLTAAQKDKVRRYFQQHQNPGGTQAEAMTEYFVQHVYTGGTSMEGSLTLEKYWSSNVQLVQSSSHMDRLVVGSMREHCNNFNATNATSVPVWDGKTYEDGYTPTGTVDNPNQMVEDYNHHKNHQDQIMLLQSVDTQMFGWYQSDASLEIVDHYRLVSGDVIQAWDNSTTASNGESADVSGMMFVGFDYEGNLAQTSRVLDNGKYIWGGNANMAAFREATDADPAESKAYFQGHTGENDKQYVLGCADGYFSDWIVRITKAVKKDIPTPPHNYTICVIGEDLTVGGADEEDLGADFDFNDVVFDVSLEATETWVRLKAAGGTLPLTIDGIEVHGKFGVDTNVMVNTGAGPQKDYVEFKLNNVYTDAKDIPVIVTKGGRPVELTAVQGKPASKIGVKTDYVWCGERVGVVSQYPLFSQWVTSMHPGTIKWY